MKKVGEILANVEVRTWPRRITSNGEETQSVVFDESGKALYFITTIIDWKAKKTRLFRCGERLKYCWVKQMREDDWDAIGNHIAAVEALLDLKLSFFDTEDGCDKIDHPWDLWKKALLFSDFKALYPVGRMKQPATEPGCLECAF